MKLIRKRKPSMKTLLGVTNAKRKFAKATGIPTTKSGRKRKAMNAVTGGAYGKYQKTRAAINRPYKSVKHPASCMGCLIYSLGLILLACCLFASLIG